MRFLEFPEGNSFWVVKWYDKYVQAHALSRSPSVEVMLQRMAIDNARDLKGYDRARIGSLLASGGSSEFYFARIAVGSLPFLRVGQVYKDRTRVGALPTSVLNLEMAGGEEDFKEVELGEELPAPPRWTPSFRLLNPSQYEVPKDAYERSRCIVRRISMGSYEMDVVIPRILIEQTFYYPESLMANAGATGPWDKYRDSLILFDSLETGLETTICSVTGNWKVLLRTRVRDHHAPMMALFAHSRYAEQSANQIYARAMADRQQKIFEPWYASGQIPFDPDLGAYELELRGFNLKSNHYKGSETFLVTHISGLSMPELMPEVEWERENSGLGSVNGHDEPTPPRGGRGQTRGKPEKPVTAQTDANPNEGNEGYDGVSIGWIKQPKARKQVKSSHTKYTGERGGQGSDSESSEGSTGADSGQKGNPGKVSGHSLLLPPSGSFRELERTLNALLEGDVISHWSVLDPGDDARREGRIGLDCWNLLPDEIRLSEQRVSRLPRRGWFILNPRHESPRARAALVVEIEMNSRVLHWIEIERREYEEGMGSPVFVDLLPPLADIQIDLALGDFSSNAGLGLRKRLAALVVRFGAPVSGRLYEHAYTMPRNSDGQTRPWNTDSVRRFLQDLAPQTRTTG